MSAVEDWAEDKSEQVAALGIFAGFAPEVSEALTEYRTHSGSYASQPPLKQWLPLYRNHRAIFLHLRTYMFNEEVFPQLLAASLGEEVSFDDEMLNSMEEGDAKPENQFFMKVWGPCWLLYKTSPVKLFRQARLGKISAFEKLLRLDNSVLFDPMLAERFHQLKVKRKRRDYERLLLALSKPATGKVSATKIKVFVAGVISFLSEKIGHRLTEPKIRSLFDAWAIDQGRGDIDTDIPDSAEAFARAINREVKALRKMEKPDKR